MIDLEAKMFKIEFNGIVGDLAYRTRREASRAIHEILEEAFGENYGEAEINLYRIVPA